MIVFRKEIFTESMKRHSWKVSSYSIGSKVMNEECRRCGNIRRSWWDVKARWKRIEYVDKDGGEVSDRLECFNNQLSLEI